ncbi:hypothetical protein XENORESO_016689, partial [Xenotaenia resolanae]
MISLTAFYTGCLQNKKAKIYCIECPRCSRDIVSITESGQGTINIQISLQPGNEKVCSEKNRDEYKEATKHPPECPRCSRVKVSMTDIGQDTFNTQISFKPENEDNEKVSSKENRDE